MNESIRIKGLMQIFLLIELFKLKSTLEHFKSNQIKHHTIFLVHALILFFAHSLHFLEHNFMVTGSNLTLKYYRTICQM